MHRGDRGEHPEPSREVMSNKWPTVKLGEVVREEREQVGTFDGDGLPVLGVTNVEGVTQTGVEASDDKSKYLRLRPGRFVYNPYRINVGSIGLSSETQNGICSPAYVVFAPTERIDAHYLRFFLKSARGNQLINFHGNRGTVRSALRFDDLCEIGVPLPPLAEQRRMAARIEEVAAQIQEARTLRDQAAEEAEAFVTSVHSDLAGKRTKKLAEIFKLDEDAVPIEPTGSYPQVGVKSFGGGLFPKGAVEGTGTTYRTFNRLYDGALLLSQVKGWEGAVAVCPPELSGWFVSPEYRTFRCIPTESRARYLAPLVRTEWFWSKLGSATRGVGARRERTRPEQFLNIELPMPDIEQQKRGEALFAEVDALKHLQTETAAELDALLPSILDRAFKGEL
jgi:type I restriction enzyme S subunit